MGLSEGDTRNGITVCYECHKKITTDGRKWFKENEKNLNSETDNK